MFFSRFFYCIVNDNVRIVFVFLAKRILTAPNFRYKGVTKVCHITSHLCFYLLYDCQKNMCLPKSTYCAICIFERNLPHISNFL